MWAHGLDDRPAIVVFEQPAGMRWQVATQLHPGSSPLEFTAPNLQYLMDSPSEFGPVTHPSIHRRRTHVPLRAASHRHRRRSSTASSRTSRRSSARRARSSASIRSTSRAHYTFLADYLPYANGDGMEHRNSTVMTAAGSIASSRDDLLDTVAHEFFHCWNVERIRPKGLEPFDFDRANISGELWLAEGFTQYYGPLAMQRAGLDDLASTARTFGRLDRERGARPGSPGALGRRDEPDGAVHRRRPHRRSHQLVDAR